MRDLVRPDEPGRPLASAATAAPGFPPPTPAPPCGCDGDPIEGLRKLFVDVFQSSALARGRDPASRPVFLRLHGVAHGSLTVRADLPEALRVGVFQPGHQYPAWVRFSSDVQPGSPDLKGTVGIGIKLFGVHGDGMPPLPGQPPGGDASSSGGRSTIQDFILQNHDVFFVDTARDMCEFTCASLNGQFDQYVAAHPITKQILDDMEKVVESVLATAYWSVLPSRFGTGRHVKYKLVPETSPPGDRPDVNDPFYLRGDLHARLKRAEARFQLCVQFQIDPETMPLDRATVRWSETASPPIHVATLAIPMQDLDERGQSAYGENLSFSPWHSLAAHQPAGSISEARRVVYAASADNRRNVNGIPIDDNPEPRPPSWQPGVPYPAAKDTRIVRAAIHPAIGVSRLGNSADEFFIGPQVVPMPPLPAGSYRDAQHALKRQAAQFRIYGYNAAGQVVSELTADSADIEWTVHVANSKAGWYQWQMAMDVPEAAAIQLSLRNKSIAGSARSTLVIDPGPKTIAGAGKAGTQYELHGAFTGVDVYLGELQTNEHGWLVFLPGRGVSASPGGSPIFNDTDPNAFINADGWYDDICDGPVTASVRIEGREIPVEAAWVLSAPPNYAPDVIGVRTLYDLLVDLYVASGWMDTPAKPSFRHDVHPILRRMSGLQWVNKGFASQFGPGGAHDFEDADYIARLARDPPADGFDVNAELRHQVLLAFRLPQPADGNQWPWPWLYGDAMDVPAIASPRQNASISQTQYDTLARWANGTFVADWNQPFTPLTSIDAVPLPQRPAMLDRAALEYCLADAFHPGCEVTWPVRHLTMFVKPFRIRHRPSGQMPPTYGKTLNQQKALSRGGPLFEQGPGDLTRWMGLPWQADTAFCRAGYDRTYDLYQPTFWPARVPNQVLTDVDYAMVIDQAQPRARRLEAFTLRTSWVEPLQGSTAEQMEQMVRVFASMGLLEERPGVQGDPDLPPKMLVASYGPGVPAPAPSVPAEAAPPEAPLTVTVPPTPLRVNRAANFRSDEEAKGAPRPVRHSRT
jgi:L-Lysine epsilon oxidase N-terminal/L-lysine epsilon oxidase C-terminal domain